MHNDPPGLSARAIGEQIGATSIEVNRLLKDQGFLYGEPGAYYLTPKGHEFGVQQVHDNGYCGYTFRSWETTHFDPKVTEVLDSSPDRLAKVREDIFERRQALNAARKVEQAKADAYFLANKGAGVEHEIDPQKVLLVIVGAVIIAGASYGIYKGVQRYQRKKTAQTDPDLRMSV